MAASEMASTWISSIALWTGMFLMVETADLSSMVPLPNNLRNSP